MWLNLLLAFTLFCCVYNHSAPPLLMAKNKKDVSFALGGEDGTHHGILEELLPENGDLSISKTSESLPGEVDEVLTITGQDNTGKAIGAHVKVAAQEDSTETSCTAISQLLRVLVNKPVVLHKPTEATATIATDVPPPFPLPPRPSPPPRPLPRPLPSINRVPLVTDLPDSSNSDLPSIPPKPALDAHKIHHFKPQK